VPILIRKKWNDMNNIIIHTNHEKENSYADQDEYIWIYSFVGELFLRQLTIRIVSNLNSKCKKPIKPTMPASLTETVCLRLTHASN
jgi:hypothetical protein